jgi:tetratricopeptide (TPR) repeat protein
MMRLVFQFLLIGVLGLAAAEPPEKALRYHQLLLKRPGDETVLMRFVQAWQEESSDGELLIWLQGDAAGGGASPWRVLASYQESMGWDDKALASLDRAVLIEPKNSALRLERAKLRARALQFEEAFADLDVAEIDPALAKEAATTRGSWLARAGRLEEAGEVWQAAIKAYPKDEILREDLIELQVIEGLYDEASASAVKLIESTRDPYKKALRQLRLAEIQVLGDEPVKGLETYQRIMAATGGGTWLEREVLAQTRRVFMREDDVQGYRDFLQKMRQEHPRRVALHKALARQMATAGEIKEAVGLYREVLGITPGDLGNLESFIAFLEGNERWEEARVELQALLKRRGEDVELWKRLAGLERQLNHPGGVAAALGEIRKLKSGNATDLVTTSLLYKEYNLGEEAERMLRAGREKFPDSDEVVEAFANLLLKNGKKEEAREIWMRIAMTGSREELLRVARSLEGQKMGGDALKVIFDRIEEFWADPLVLTQLCQLTGTEEEGVKILPHALGLVRLAKSPTELESAIPLALSVIEIGKMEREAIAMLEELESRGIPDLCLLAELLASGGDLGRADEMLNQVEGDLLGKFYRVSFDEKRGDRKAAVARLEEIVALPGQKKTVHLRRLTELHRRLENKEKAMAWVDEWKRVAPGDHLAWMVRADLLLGVGRNEEAILELRRLVGKFGPGEGRRVKLAEAQIKVGNGRAAQKIYRKLYEEAGTIEEKLRWLSKWTQLAQADGSLKGFLAEFQRRKRTNPRSVAPLLALAEIYGFLDRPEEQRRALEEAADRRNTDPHLLHRLAELEEKSGNLEKAVGFLKKADLLDQGEKSKRALGLLYSRAGRLKEMMAVIQTIPSEIERPRQVEVRVEWLVKNGHWAIAEEYLTDLLPRFPEDWRLKYFAGVLKKQDWRVAEAAVIFGELEEVRNPIAGLAPSPRTLVQVLSPGGVGFHRFWSPEMKLLWETWGEMTGGRRDLFDRENIYRVSERNGMGAWFHLPVSAAEVRRKSFLSILMINEMELDRVKREAGFDAILARHEMDRRLFAMASFRPVRYRRELEKLMGANPGKVGLKEQWLASEVKGEGLDAKLLEGIFGEFIEMNPAGLLAQLSDLLERGVVAESDVWRLARASYDRVEGEKKDESLRNLLALAQQLPVDAESIGFLVEEVLDREKLSVNPGELKKLVRYAVVGEDHGRLVPLLNHLVRGMAKPAVHVYQQQKYMVAFPSIEDSERGVFQSFNGWPLEWLVGKGSVPVTTSGNLNEERRRELYSELGVAVERKVEGDAVLKKAVLEADSRLFKGKVLMSIGAVAEAGPLAREMAGSTEMEEVYFAAAYEAHTGQLEKSYRLFEKLEGMIKVPKDHPEIALSTVNVAYDLVTKNGGVIDLGAAKRALRIVDDGGVGVFRLDELAWAFGMSPSFANSSVTLNGITNGGAVWNGRGIHLGARLIGRLGPDRVKVAVKVAELSLRDLFSSTVKRSDETRQIKDALDKKNLVINVLQAMKPEVGAGPGELMEFARMAFALERGTTAGRYFEMVLAIDPGNREALVGRFMTGQSLVQEAASVFSLKDHGEEACHRVRVFFENYDSDDGGDLERLVTLNVVRGYLRELPSAADQDQYLSWVFPCLKDLQVAGGAERADISDEAKNQCRQILKILLGRSQYSDQVFQMLLPLLRPENRSKAANLSLRGRLQAKRTEATERRVPMIYQSRKDGLTRVLGFGEVEVGDERGMDLDYLLGLGDAGEEVAFEPKTLEVMKEHFPEFHEDLETARRIGEGDEIYEGWLTRLPDDPELQVERTVSFLKCLIFFGHGKGAWLEGFQERFATAVVAGAMNERSEFLVGEWFAILAKDGGAAMIRRQTGVMIAAALGDQKKWPALIELGVGSFPPVYQDRFANFSKAIVHVMGMNRRSYDVLSELLASVAHPLMVDFKEVYLESWPGNGISGEIFFKLLKQNGVLDRDADGKLSVDRVLVMAEALAGLPVPREEIKESLPSLVRQDDAVEPFLKKMLLSHCGAVNDLRVEVDLRRDLILAMEKKDPTVTCHFLGNLYPDYNGSFVLADVLRRVKTVVLDERLSDLDAEIKKGGFELQDRRELINYLLFEVARLDIIAAARAAEQMLLKGDEFLKANPGKVLLPLGRKKALLPVDRLIGELLLVFANGGEWIPEEDLWKFYDFLCRGKVGELISVPTEARGLVTYDAVQNAFGTKSLEGIPSSIQELMSDKLSKLTPGERQTYVVFCFLQLTNFWEKALDEGDDFASLEKEIRVKFPELADLFCGLRLAGAAGVSDDEDLRKRAEICFERYFASCDLPVALRMDMVTNIFWERSVRACLTSEASWGWATKGMDDYLSGAGQRSLLPLLSLIATLEDGDFVGMGGKLGAFVEVASRVIFEDPDPKRSGDLRAMAIEALIPGAILAGKMEIVGKLLEVEPARFQGNLAMVWRLSQSNNPVLLLPLLLDSKRLYRLYSTESLPEFSRESAEKLAGLLQLMPEDERYRLEVLYSNVPDAKGEAAPLISRPKRLRALATRFKAEGPKARSGRLQILHSFLGDKLASAEVGVEMREIEVKEGIGMVLNAFKSDPAWEIHAQIIRKVLMFDLAKGEFESTMRHLRSLVPAGRIKDTHTEKEAGALLLKLVDELLPRAAVSPAAAQKYLPMIRSLLESSLTSKWEEWPQPMKTLEALTVTIHALAESSLDKAMEEFPEDAKKSYQRFRRRGFLFARLKNLKTDHWISDENSEVRAKVVAALLADSYVQNELGSEPLLRLGELTRSGFVGEEELKGMIDGMADDHPMKSEFMWYRAMVTGDFEKASACFTKAAELAVAKKDEELRHRILFDFVARAFDKTKLEVAEEILKKLDPEKLTRGQGLRIEAMKAK